MTAMKMFTKALPARRRPRSVFTIGAVFLLIIGTAGTMLAFKEQLHTMLRSGETITAEFAGNHNLVAHQTVVKVAGLDVGRVSDVERTDTGTVLVSMKVSASTLEVLGPKPSAVITPNTLLGGRYAVELVRGGGRGTFEGAFIPQDRTTVPVELDRILESLPRPTRQAAQHLVGHLEGTLAHGKDALRDLVTRMPATLNPAGDVLHAAQGTRPGVDLPQIVTNFHATADVLSHYEGQLGNIVTSLRDTTTVLAQQSRPLADGIESLPTTLRATRAGMIDVRGTLDKLTATADPFRPTAKELAPLLRQLDPVLRKAQPLLADLRPLLRDARPLVDQLVPVAQRGTKVLDDVSGPTLDRVNGPIAHTVMNTWRGSGPYEGSGGGTQADHKFYEELGYLAAKLTRVSMTQDAQGSLLAFQLGANTESVVGTPFTLPNLVDAMKKHAGGAR